MRNRFFFGAFAVLLVLFLFFMFFTRVGRAQTVSIPEPILGAPEGPYIAAAPPTMYLQTTPSPEHHVPAIAEPLPVEEEFPAPPHQPAPGRGPANDPANELPDPGGAPVSAPPDDPSYA